MQITERVGRGGVTALWSRHTVLDHRTSQRQVRDRHIDAGLTLLLTTTSSTAAAAAAAASAAARTLTKRLARDITAAGSTAARCLTRCITSLDPATCRGCAKLMFLWRAASAGAHFGSWRVPMLIYGGWRVPMLITRLLGTTAEGYILTTNGRSPLHRHVAPPPRRSVTEECSQLDCTTFRPRDEPLVMHTSEFVQRAIVPPEASHATPCPPRPITSNKQPMYELPPARTAPGTQVNPRRQSRVH